MNAQTEAAITAVCAADPTIKKADFAAALRLLRGERSAAVSAEGKDEILTRKEAARLLRVSLATVTAWGKDGTIRRVALDGRRKALGFSRRSVFNVINGTGEKWQATV